MWANRGVNTNINTVYYQSADYIKRPPYRRVFEIQNHQHVYPPFGLQQQLYRHYAFQTSDTKHHDYAIIFERNANNQDLYSTFW